MLLFNNKIMNWIRKNIIWIVLAILTLGCGSSKKVKESTKEVEKVTDSIKITNVVKIVDTVEVFKDRIITRPVTQYVEIPIECDSLGNVKPVSYKTGSGAVKAELLIKENNLIISTKIDSLVSHYEKEYRSKFVNDSLALEQKLKEKYSKEVSEHTKITGYPWYYKLLMIVLAIGAIAFIAWNIYKKINPFI